MSIEMRITFDKYDELIKLKDLKKSRFQRNKHSKDQIERLAKIMANHGVRQPIHISKQTGEVCFGHGRWAAALHNKWKEYPVVYQDFKDEDEEYACVQSDNGIAHWAELDLQQINIDIQDMGPDFDIDLLGIKDFTIDAADKYGSDEDTVPDLPKEPISKLGDIYALGEHRLMCGDSTDKSTVEMLMNGEKADMVFTDPPYNLEERGQLKRTNKTESKTENFGDWDVGFDPIKALENIVHSTQENAHIFVCTSNYLFGSIHDWLEKQGHKPNYLVWCKANPMPSLSKKSFVQSTELIVHSRKGSPDFIYPSGSNLRNIIDGNVKKHEFGHPTQKPLYVIEYCLTPTVGSVLDLFGGSGSTLIACEKTKRKCFMMELDPHYIDVIVSRWCKFTSQTKIKRNNKDVDWQT